MINERNTENLVCDILEEKGYRNNKNIIIEEQKSKNSKINNLLKNASKSVNVEGKSDFIISFLNKLDTLIWINDRMEKSKIKLPIDINQNPEWKFMEDYIKSLNYSFNLKSINHSKDNS